MRDGALSFPDVHGRGEILSHLIDFGRALKERGFRITPGRVIHAARSVELIDISRREDFSAALKTNFVSKKAELPLFDELFNQFWSRMKKMQRPSPPAETEESESEGGSSNEAPSLSLDSGPSPLKDESEEKERRREYSPHEVLMAKDFSQFLADEKEVLDREDAQLLDSEMKRLRRKARNLIWLNPLLGTPEYQPLCQGMRTALPYIDHFLPASTLKGLHGLGDALVELSG